MTERPPKNSRKPPPSGSTRPSSPGEPDPQRDRPTLSPPFDLQAFARAATSTDEGDEARGAGEGAGNRSERITITNEVELELARARSADDAEPPLPRGPAPRTSILSLADALTPSSAPFRSAPPVAQGSFRGGLADEATDVRDGLARASVPAPEIIEHTLDPVTEMRDRYSLGDFTGALEMAELILTGDPSDEEAREHAESCRRVLEKMYVAKIGSLDHVPEIIVARTQMRWLSIDHRAGFILSLVDGVSTVEMVLDVSGMPRLDALRILHDLVQQHIVAIR